MLLLGHHVAGTRLGAAPTAGPLDHLVTDDGHRVVARDVQVGYGHPELLAIRDDRECQRQRENAGPGRQSKVAAPV